MARQPTAFRGGLTLADLMTKLRGNVRASQANDFDLPKFLEGLKTAQTGPVDVGILPPRPETPVDGAAAAASAPAASTQGDAYKPSGWAVFDRVLGGDTITEARRNLRNEHLAELAAQEAAQARAAQRAQLEEAMKTITDPRERLALLLNPDKYGEYISSRFGAADVAGGSSRVYGDPNNGGSVYTAPKVDMSGDSGVVLTPDGMKVLGQRPISQGEKIELEKLAEAKRKTDLQDKAAWGRINKPAAGRGGGGAAKLKPWERIYHGGS